MNSKQFSKRLASIAVAALALGGTASAAEPAWPAAPYDYVVVDQDLRTVLLQFGANIGTRIALSDGVGGRVHGHLPVLPPRQFLDHLAQSYGLDWFFDGTTLAVSATGETETRFVTLPGVGVPALQAALQATGLYDARFALRAGPAAGTAMVSGPPRYLRLVEQTAAALAQPAPAPRPPDAVPLLTVFRGGAVSKVQFP